MTQRLLQPPSVVRTVPRVLAPRPQIPGADRRIACVSICSLALSTGGCGDPLVAPELIQGVRVLGARVQANTDPGRASVAPSETATLRWLVVSPQGPPVLSWAFTLCAAQPVSRGLAICAGPNFARFASEQPSSDEPRFEFPMPDASFVSGTAQITANGVFCVSGNPILGKANAATTDSRCPDRSERPLFAAMGISVATNGETNQNPSLESLDASIDQTAWHVWSEPDPPESGCAHLGDTLPTVKAGSAQHAIVLTLPGTLAEPLETISPHSAARETIQLSHFVTAGDLERAYSTVDTSKLAPKVKLTWDAPTNISSDGTLVRFFFVLRDRRGGVDWTRRALCVVERLPLR